MRGLVDIRPSERRPTLLAFLCLFGITAGHTLLETARDALFLAKLPAARLPWMYLIIAGIGLGLSRLNRRRSARPASRYAVTVSLCIAAAINAAFWAASSWRGAWLLYALYVWTGIFASWVIVQFWLLLGNLFTVGQAKRLYGFVGAGSVLGAVVGAAFARALASVLAAQHLLLGSAFMLVLTGLGPALVLRPTTIEEPTRGPIATDPLTPPSLTEDLALASGDPYVRRILALVLVSTIALTTVDYLFKASVAAHIPPEQYGAFFANVYVIFNGAALVVQVGLVGFLLRTFGVHRALWVMPVLVLFGATGVAAGGGLALALLLKGTDGALRHSLHRTSTELLYLPIPDATRTRAKPFIDLVGQRGGQAIASVAILGLVALGVKETGLAIAVAILAIGWILAISGIKKPYLDVFRATLRRGRVDFDGDLPELDLGALESLFAGLNSAKDAEVLGALELLAAQDRQRLIPALILYHPSPAIVLKALAIFAQEKRTDFFPIADRLLLHADPEVKAAALRARASAQPDADLLRSKLDDECLEVRATALVSLFARGLLKGDEAERSLHALSDDPSPAVRVALAKAIGQEPLPVFEETLLSLAKAKEPDVRAEAALAMGKMASLRFVPVLAEMLPDREPGIAAREALAAMGSKALPLLDRAMSDPETPRAVRWALPRALAHFGPPDAAPFLLRHLASAKDGMVRFRILRALVRLRAEDPTVALDGEILATATEAAVRSAFRLLDWRGIIERGPSEVEKRRTPAHELLVTMLRDKETHAVERTFQLLGLSHPSENFERIYRGLQRKDPKARASSRELIENLVGPPLRSALLVLLDDLPDEERLARATSFHRGERRQYDELVLAAVERGGELASIASYHAAELGLLRADASVDTSAREPWNALGKVLRGATPKVLNELGPQHV